MSNYSETTQGKTAINTTGESVKWRMFFFDKSGIKILECCEYAVDSSTAIAKVLGELKDKKIKSAIRSIDSVIEA